MLFMRSRPIITIVLNRWNEINIFLLIRIIVIDLNIDNLK